MLRSNIVASVILAASMLTSAPNAHSLTLSLICTEGSVPPGFVGPSSITGRCTMLWNPGGLVLSAQHSTVLIPLDPATADGDEGTWGMKRMF